MPEGNPTAQHLPPPALPWVRGTSLVLGVGAILSSLGLGGAALLLGAQAYWLLLSMELTIAAAGVVAVLFGLKRFQQGPGLALACCAGAVLAPAFLGWLNVTQAQRENGLRLSSGGMLSVHPWLAARVLLAMALAALGAFEVLRRDRRSVWYLLRALMTGVPLLLVMGGLVAGRNVIRTQAAVPAWIAWTGAVLGAVIAMVLVCATAHLLIRAFEMGRPGARGGPAIADPKPA